MSVSKVIGGIEKFNKIHGTSLGLEELKFCYSLNRQTYGYSLLARNNAPSLVLDLPNSHKGTNDDVVILIGDIVPNPLYKPIPQ